MPPHKFKKVLPVAGRFQWDESGGFCGSLSIQTMALTYGAWISQDVVRKANRGGLCFGHTDEHQGCEVGPENYGLTARNLKLKYDEWDFAQHMPQAPEFKKWIKAHLVKGEPVMWAPMLKNGKHTLYGRVSVPGNGHFDHHEPIIGIGSNHDLNDLNVYDDDWLVHYSDYDLQPCYRRFSSLADDAKLQGNCKNVREGQGVMYPCFFENATYGLAVTGLGMFATSPLRVSLAVDRPDEPRIRLGYAPAKLKGAVTVQGLQPGRHYVLYRYNSTEALPDGAAIDLLDVNYEHRTPFTALTTEWHFQDPHPIMSNTATYYVAVQASDSTLNVVDSLKQDVPLTFLRAAEKSGADEEDISKDVRPTGDPELAIAPSYKSLATSVATPVPQGSWLTPFAAMAVTSLLSVIAYSRRRSAVLLNEPCLG